MNNNISNLQYTHARAIIWSILHYICFNAGKNCMHYITHERLYDRIPDYDIIFNLCVKDFLINNDLTNILDQLIDHKYDDIIPQQLVIREYVAIVYPKFTEYLKADDTSNLFKKLIESVRNGSQEAMKNIDPLEFVHPCDRCENLKFVKNIWTHTPVNNERSRLLANYIDNLDQFAQALPGYTINK